MSVVDNVLKANKLCSKSYTNNHLPAPPALKLAVITCKDARLMVEGILGLKEGNLTASSQRGRGGYARRYPLAAGVALYAWRAGSDDHQPYGLRHDGFRRAELFTTVRQVTSTQQLGGTMRAFTDV